jgi:hypothetical protein
MTAPQNARADRDAALNELAKALLATDPSLRRLESENPSKAFKLALSRAGKMIDNRPSTS